MKLDNLKVINTLLLLIMTLAIFSFVILIVYNKKQVLLDNKIKCQQIGYELYEKEKANYKGVPNPVSSPRFKFNEGLNTCLYRGSIDTIEIKTNFIKDVYTNEIIVEFTEGSGEYNYLNKGSVSEFSKRYKELFKE